MNNTGWNDLTVRPSVSYPKRYAINGTDASYDITSTNDAATTVVQQQKIRVLAVHLNGSAAGDIVFQSVNPGGATELFRLDYGAAGDKTLPHNPDGWIATLETGDTLRIVNGVTELKGIVVYVDTTAP